MSQKKIVNTNCPEFGYELLSALPYAYNLYLKGELLETISAYDTSCLYFFSPKHTEVSIKRNWDNMKILWEKNFPNINIHRSELDWEYFSPPPLKEFYSDKKIVFEKETIVIFNRFNKEWGGNPINYLDLNTIDSLFSLLENEYQIVYINIKGDNRYYDHSEPLELNDESILLKHPSVITIDNLKDKFPYLTINEIQCRLFANCNKFISSNGGSLILSAYFGGENIIFSKKCRELDESVNSFYKWYHKLGNGVFQHINNENELINLVKVKWVEKKPLINILIRTSGRPNYFNDCVKSIYTQTYKNWNIIIGIDDKDSKKYTQIAKGREIYYSYDASKIPPPPSSNEYGIKFKYNLYLNDLQNNVQDGFVLILDDDNELYDKLSLEKIVNNIKSNDDLIFWRVKFPTKLVPMDSNFGKEPKVLDIDSAGFLFHIKNKQKWEPYKRGDFRVAKKLYQLPTNKIYINETLTKLQRIREGGFGLKDDKNFNLSELLTIIIPTFKNPTMLSECLNSIRGYSDCEILVGIDGCEETLEYVKKNKYNENIRFFYFDKNNGPYIVRNSLAKISNSDILLFFDSDDIMKENLISDILGRMSANDFVKPMYSDFTNTPNYNITRSNTYGEGVFAIKKDLFLSMNGFEPWPVAADSDFMGRLYKNNKKFSYTNDVVFYRRVHPNSLTQRKDTGLSSPLRGKYYSMSKRKSNFGPLQELVTSTFYEVNTNKISNTDPYIEVTPKKDISAILTHPKTIDYGRINEILGKKPEQKVLPNQKPEKPQVQQNKPISRNVVNDNKNLQRHNLAKLSIKKK